MHNFRSNFPILHIPYRGKQLIYLDNAATTHKPQAVIDAVTHFYTHDNATVYRGVYHLAEHATSMYEQARANVASFIGAHAPAEIVFTSGTTESINLVAATWAQSLRASDEIVISELEHHANILPWQALVQSKGIILKFIPVLPNGMLDLSLLPRLLTHKTKLVAVTHISNALGTHNDIRAIIQAAHAVGAKVLVDAAQSVAHQQLNVVELDVDFLAFSGHKIFGPCGIGVLYVKQELHQELPPYKRGGGMVYEADFSSSSFLDFPHRLEAGTPPIAAAIGLSAAIDYMRANIDYDVLQRHEAHLTAALIDGLVAIKRIRVLGPVEQLRSHGSIVSFVIDDMHPHDVAAYLDQFGICVRAGHHCAQPLAKKMGIEASVRVSFAVYNTMEEVEALLKALQQVVAF
jgi:cysteine desulfurase/selenocysteine lyase